MAYKVSSGSAAVAAAKQWIGTPYCWGGGHGGQVPIGTCVDCSGLVNQVFGTSGTTFTQVALGSPIPDISSALPGDLVFFGPLAPGEPHHVGIYVGGGRMIDAPHTGTVVRYDAVSGFGPINAIRRLVGPGAASDSGVDSSNQNVTFNYAQLEGIWIMAGGNKQYADMAAAIAMAESAGKANNSGTNSNGSVDRGLWAINSVNGSASSLDVMTNARGAVSISNNGTNWRPWCTAYDDGACGTKGGAYLGFNAPFRKFFNDSVAPDMNVPINATNGAAGQPDNQNPTADEVSFNCGSLGFFFAPNGLCNSAGASSVLGPLNPMNVVNGIIGAVLNPLIQIVAGVMGITAGAALMLIGLYLIASQSKSVQQGKQAAMKIGSLAVPEARAAQGAESVTSYRGVNRQGQPTITHVQRRSVGQPGQRQVQTQSTKYVLRGEAWEHVQGGGGTRG